MVIPQQSSPATTVIVGSSIAGVRTAQALRAAGYPGAVVLVGEETALPYDKPPLSKALLSGARTSSDIVLLSEGQAAELDVQLRLGHAAVGLDPAARTVELSDGARLRYDDLVIATGARARPSPWGTPPGVHVLRSIDDAVAIGERLRRGGRLVVVGAGFIGAEVAATARGLGVADVTVVDPVAVPLSRVLNPEVAEHFGALYRRHGIRTVFGVGVRGIDEGPSVRLDNGEVLPADTVVVGIGAVPNDGWLAGSGIRCADGVLCDRYSRSVDDPRVHAVGDVARWQHPGRPVPIRVEHWTNAVEQANCVAHNIAHPDDLHVHAPVEYVWSDQHDWKIQLVGRTGAELSHLQVDGDDPGRAFAVLYGDATGVFVGAVIVNSPRAMLLCRRALAGGAVSVAEMREKVAAALRPRVPAAPPVH